MSNNYGPKIVTDGLVLCLDAADQNSYSGSGNTWTDLSGNGNNGTLTNGTTFSNANNGVFSFDGVNDSIQGPNSSSLMVTTNFTLSVWVKRTVDQSREQVLLAKNGEAGPWVGWELMFSTSNTIGLWTSGSAGSGWDYFSYSVTNLDWNNITVTFSGTSGGTGTALLYINGEYVASIQNKKTPGTPSLRVFEIGKIRNTRYLSGKISQAQIYNKTLTEQQIQQNYNATKGRFGL
jgi:hypothetical protein